MEALILGWGEPYDLNHWNSIARRGNNILMSFRHLDAILLVNRRTGDIKWKLGGTRTAEAIAHAPNDHLAASFRFGGQHDARFAPGGSITVFDNQTDLNQPKNQKPPRAVRYRIDREAVRTNVGQEDKGPRGDQLVTVSDPPAWSTGATGSSTGAPSVSEQQIGGYRPDGSSVFRLRTPENLSYRAIPAKARNPPSNGYGWRWTGCTDRERANDHA